MARHMTHDDRLQLEALYQARVPVSRIAATLGVHPSTIYRELRRGHYLRRDYAWVDCPAYSADIAEERYHRLTLDNGPAPKIGNRHDICQLLSTWLLQGASPAICAYRLRMEGYDITLCTQTIYTYIRRGYIPGVTMGRLPYADRRKERKAKVIHKRARRAAGASIERRPASILTREEFGHWEIDCIVGRASGERQALLTLTERKTRYEIIGRLARKDAKSVVSFLDTLQDQFGPAFPVIFKSITADNGPEFADCYGMEHSQDGSKRTQMYYAHPYCSSERGTNERNNQILRRWWPKGQSLFGVTQRDCNRVAALVNAMPRAVLGWQAAAQLWESALLDLGIKFSPKKFCICS